MMTSKEAVLKSLQELRKTSTYLEVYEHIIKNGYYDFGDSKTPSQSVSAQLGNFIRTGDSRVQRVKRKNGSFAYYLAKLKNELIIEETQLSDNDLNRNDTYGFTKLNLDFPENEESQSTEKQPYRERDLHILLSSYLKNQNVFSKTILHEKSTRKDDHQKWIHPDMVGVNFLNLQNKVNQTFLKVINRADAFKITSYEIKKEINTDYDLKKYFFQAVSNSSWANYGYLVAFEINSSLSDEMERLNQSFGIGIIELKANPFESKVLYSSRYKDLDFKTIDKLCNINTDFEKFIEQVEKLLTASERYVPSTQLELKNFCDDYFTNDSEIEKYCEKTNIPIPMIYDDFFKLD